MAVLPKGGLVDHPQAVLRQQGVEMPVRQQHGVLEIQRVGVLAIQQQLEVRIGEDQALARLQESRDVGHEFPRVIDVFHDLGKDHRIRLFPGDQHRVEKGLDDPDIARGDDGGVGFHDRPVDLRPPVQHGFGQDPRTSADLEDRMDIPVQDVGGQVVVVPLPRGPAAVKMLFAIEDLQRDEAGQLDDPGLGIDRPDHIGAQVVLGRRVDRAEKHRGNP